MITLLLSIYGSVLSTIVFVYAFYKDREKVKITYTEEAIFDFDKDNTEDFWVYTVVNESPRKLYVKNFFFFDREGTIIGLKNRSDWDEIEAQKTVIIEPHRSIKIFYDKDALDKNKIFPQSFYLEEENGKRHFMNNVFRRTFKKRKGAKL